MHDVFSVLRNCFFSVLLLVPFVLNAYSIVFVHIGPSIPEYLSTTIAQARLFNKECQIYLIANQVAIENRSERFNASGVFFVPCESLPSSPTHQVFHNNRLHDWGGDGFWVYTSERFFYLEEFVKQYQLSDVFHLENDIMLYVDFSELISTCQNRYQGMIGATFENDNRCVPGIMYISNHKPLAELIEFFPKQINIMQTDMETLAHFKNRNHKTFIDYLPIVMPEYCNNHSLEVFSVKPVEPALFSNHYHEFNSIFDAAAFGVYLGGMDSKFHIDSAPGKIDVFCIFNPSFFSVDWKIDLEGRRVPFVSYNGHQTRVNNLHITNKSRISQFFSLD